MPTKIVKNSGRKPPAAGKGRPRGSRNKVTALLKDAILRAATDAGNGDMAAYLKGRAIDTPGPFLALLGKVLPLQLANNDDGEPVTMIYVTGVPRHDDPEI